MHNKQRHYIALYGFCFGIGLYIFIALIYARDQFQEQLILMWTEALQSGGNPLSLLIGTILGAIVSIAFCGSIGSWLMLMWFYGPGPENIEETNND